MDADEKDSPLASLLSEALDKPESQRQAFINFVTEGNSDLHDELSSLVSSYDEASNFFDDFASDLGLPGAQLETPKYMSNDPSALIGKTISQYRIDAYIGGGGMGMVYKAEDQNLKRNAALKFLPVALGHDPVAKERFLREARAASALDHPHICTVFEIGEDNGRPYIAMAYYDGQTIEQSIEHGPMDIDRTIKLAIEMSDALAAAHTKGVVHRDIKPANVIVSEAGISTILDFGLAQSEHGGLVTQEGAILGTAAYMSPEQATGAKVDFRTDIWSLGAVLYEMLSGTRPFGGGYPQAIMYGILNMDPEPLSALRPGLPMQLIQVVEKALVKKPEGRYARMADMTDALRSVQDRIRAKSAAKSMIENDSGADLRTPSAVAESPSRAPEVASPIDENVVHILCVDDEPELELLMQQRFRKKIRAGEWKFEFALDGQEALLKLEKFPNIGLILTDLNMPRMDGLTLLGKLAELQRPMRTIVVSAYGDLEKIRVAMNRGAFDFVTKPIEFKDLETTILKAERDLEAYRKALRGQQQAVSVQQEMDIARRVQDAIMPVSFPEGEGFTVYGFSAPAADVSGTFYDAFETTDGKIGLILGDAGGRGVAAALLMAMGQTFVKSFMKQGMSPSECLAQLNTMLFADGLPNVGLKIVASLFDPATGQLLMANAGHEAPIIFRGDGSIDTPGQTTSVIWEDGAAEFSNMELQLAGSDALVFVSAGLIRTVNETGDAFSRERLASVLRETSDPRPTSLIRHIVRAVQEYAGDTDPREDLTILALLRS
jgi:serine/threonine protein kinase/serine phosphatase RsbU (regulator of sigma subunit)